MFLSLIAVYKNLPIIGDFPLLFIHITKLESNEIFSPSNKIHRKVGRAKDSSAPLYRRLDGSQCRYGRVRKHSLRLGFDNRTAQPVTICYTDGAFAGLNCNYINITIDISPNNAQHLHLKWSTSTSNWNSVFKISKVWSGRGSYSFSIRNWADYGCEML
jgi:hypothetical protein